MDYIDERLFAAAHYSDISLKSHNMLLAEKACVEEILEKLDCLYDTPGRTFDVAITFGGENEENIRKGITAINYGAFSKEQAQAYFQDGLNQINHRLAITGNFFEKSAEVGHSFAESACGKNNDKGFTIKNPHGFGITNL